MEAEAATARKSWRGGAHRAGPVATTPHNRVALVTGASRGLGRGIAIELAKAGWSVGINYAGNAAAADLRFESEAFVRVGPDSVARLDSAAQPEGRIIAYLRPEFPSIGDWLAAT